MKTLIATLLLGMACASSSFSFVHDDDPKAAKKKCAASCESHAAFSKAHTRAGAINASRQAQAKAATPEKDATKTK